MRLAQVPSGTAPSRSQRAAENAIMGCGRSNEDASCSNPTHNSDRETESGRSNVRCNYSRRRRGRHADGLVSERIYVPPPLESVPKMQTMFCKWLQNCLRRIRSHLQCPVAIFPHRMQSRADDILHSHLVRAEETCSNFARWGKIVLRTTNNPIFFLSLAKFEQTDVSDCD